MGKNAERMRKDLEHRMFLHAYNLIKNKATWLQHESALDASGNLICTKLQVPVAFSSIGALTDAYEAFSNEELAEEISQSLASKFGMYVLHKKQTNLVQYNYTHSHEEVVQLWQDFAASKGYKI